MKPEPATTGDPATPFNATPAFAHFRDVMRKLIQVPKSELDRMVQESKDSSPRKDNPSAPGRKRSKG